MPDLGRGFWATFDVVRQRNRLLELLLVFTNVLEEDNEKMRLKALWARCSPLLACDLWLGSDGLLSIGPTPIRAAVFKPLTSLRRSWLASHRRLPVRRFRYPSYETH